MEVSQPDAVTLAILKDPGLQYPDPQPNDFFDYAAKRISRLGEILEKICQCTRAFS